MSSKGHLNMLKPKTQTTAQATDLVRSLLTDRTERLGRSGAADIKGHPFFHGVDFGKLRQPGMPPFKPTVASITDTSNFDQFDERPPPNSSSAPPSRETDLAFVGYTFSRYRSASDHQLLERLSGNTLLCTHADDSWNGWGASSSTTVEGRCTGHGSVARVSWAGGNHVEVLPSESETEEGGGTTHDVAPPPHLQHQMGGIHEEAYSNSAPGYSFAPRLHVGLRPSVQLTGGGADLRGTPAASPLLHLL